MGIGSLQPTQTLRFFAPTFNTQGGGETNPLGGNYHPPKLVLETDGQKDVEVLGCVELLDAQQSARRGWRAAHCGETDELGNPLFLSLKRDEHYNIEFSNSNDQNNKFELGDSLILKSYDTQHLPHHIVPIESAPLLEEEQRWSKGDVFFLSWWDEGQNGGFEGNVHETTTTTGFPSKLTFWSESKGGERWVLGLVPKWWIPVVTAWYDGGVYTAEPIPTSPLMSIDFRIEFS